MMNAPASAATCVKRPNKTAAETTASNTAIPLNRFSEPEKCFHAAFARTSASAILISNAENGARKSMLGKTESIWTVYSRRLIVNSMAKTIAVLLHNIRSTHNVGSIFRTADAAEISCVYLSGFTPAPIDRFGRVQKDIAKTALGAEKNIKWEHISSPMRLIEKLKNNGWAIVGVEQDKRSIDYRRFEMKKSTLFIFGNEVRGLLASLRAKCDVLIEIPMRGAMVRQAHHPRRTRRGKESLNVSVAAGIVLFRMLP